ncbi:MAG: hypothetical protein WD066_19945 [Planctomycetaceae bacterium]
MNELIVVGVVCLLVPAQVEAQVAENLVRPSPRLIALALADVSSRAVDTDYEFLCRALDEVVRTQGADVGRYSRDDYRQLSFQRMTLPGIVPRGATILQGVAVHSGVAEVERVDLATTIFRITGKRPAHLDEGIPSRGAWRTDYRLYDIGREHECLVVGQSGGELGHVEVMAWNIRENIIDHFWSVGGDEAGSDFSHAMGFGPDGLELVISGIRAEKRAGYEAERRTLEEKLGFRVRFEYVEE